MVMKIEEYLEKTGFTDLEANMTVRSAATMAEDFLDCNKNELFKAAEAVQPVDNGEDQGMVYTSGDLTAEVDVTQEKLNDFLSSEVIVINGQEFISKQKTVSLLEKFVAQQVAESTGHFMNTIQDNWRIHNEIIAENDREIARLNSEADFNIKSIERKKKLISDYETQLQAKEAGLTETKLQLENWKAEAKFSHIECQRLRDGIKNVMESEFYKQYCSGGNMNRIFEDLLQPQTPKEGGEG